MNKYIKPVNLIIFLAVVIVLVSIFIASSVEISEIVNIDDDGDKAVAEIDIARVYNSKGDKSLERIPTRLNNDTYHIFINPKMSDAYTPIYIKVTSVNVLYTVSVGDEIIFRNSFNPVLKNLGYPSVNLVRVPEQYDGKNVKITFRSTSKNAKYTNIPSIHIGSKRAILVAAQNKNYLELMMGILIFIISYIAFFAAFILFKAKANYSQTYYISIFSFIMSVIIVLNTEFVKLLLSENTVLYYIYYILFAVASIPLLLLSYYQVKINKAGQWRSMLMQYTLYIEAIIVLVEICYIALHYKQPTNLIIFSFINVILALISTSVSIFTLNIKKYKVKPILIIIMILISFIIIENFELYIGLSGVAKTFHLTSVFTLIFLSVYFYIALNTYFTSYKQLEITQFYENVAFVDSLTRVRTRHALENDIQIIYEKNYNKLIIVFIDVNHLKQINDNRGHAVGDIVLQKLGQLINEIERKYSHVNGYRFGGDEFIIILKKPDKSVAENIKQFLKEETAAIRESEHAIPISLAIAYDEIVLKKNMDIDDIIKSADKKMYLDKEKQ